MKRRWLLICASVGLLVLVIFGVMSGRILYFDGPYHGRVIDKETKRPIEGAAVLAVWWKETGLLVPHPIISFYDAQETLTDQGGNFTIPGMWSRLSSPFSKIKEPLFTIFKPKYEAYKQVRLGSARKEGRSIAELRPLKTRQKRIRNLYGLHPGPLVPDKKTRNLIKLMNVEERKLGLKPTRLPEGDRH